MKQNIIANAISGHLNTTDRIHFNKVLISSENNFLKDTCKLKRFFKNPRLNRLVLKSCDVVKSFNTNGKIKGNVRAFKHKLHTCGGLVYYYQDVEVFNLVESWCHV